MPGKEISSGTKNETEAVQFDEKYLQNFDNKRKTNSIPTLREYAAGFYIDDKHGFKKQMEKKKKFFKNEYWKKQESVLQKYWIKTFGDLLISAISADMIDDWYMEFKSNRSGSELSDNSKNKILACGNNVFVKALRDKIITENPINSIVKITEENKSREHFNDIEIAKLFPSNKIDLIRIWQSKKWALYFLIMRDTGWRPGEVAGLKRQNYYPNFGGIYTENSIDYTDGSVQDRIKTTRNGKNYKIGYLSDLTVSILEKYIEENIPVYSLLFTSRKGSGLKPEVSNKHFKHPVKEQILKEKEELNIQEKKKN